MTRAQRRHCMSPTRTTYGPDDGSIAGYQNWRDLAFLHWRVDAAALQRQVPAGLTIETFDGSAWIGVVPFGMERIRPRWSPPIPGVSWFLETNVRTYVVDASGTPGVWFFSLDASKRLAVWTARTFWHLPYHFAALTLERSNSAGPNSASTTIHYRGVRRGAPAAAYDVSLNVDSGAPHAALAGTLDDFLVERYLLFTQRRDGTLMSGRVHHEPYQLRPAHAASVSQTLTAALGCAIPASRAPDHAVFSPGVDVCVSRLAVHTSY